MTADGGPELVQLLTPEGERTLRRLREVLVTPEADLRATLKHIHATSPSALARDLAGTLMGMVDDTFSGVYANANRATRCRGWCWMAC